MDLPTYETLKKEIFNSCERCQKKYAALDVLYDRTSAPLMTATAPPKDRQSLHCAYCPNRVRRDNTGCPKCGQRVCKDHKRPSGSSKSGVCTKCAPDLPDGRNGNGGAHLNSGPNKRGRPLIQSADPISPEEVIRRGMHLSEIEKELAAGGIPFQVAEKFNVDRKWVVTLQAKLTRQGIRK